MNWLHFVLFLTFKSIKYEKKILYSLAKIIHFLNKLSMFIDSNL